MMKGGARLRLDLDEGWCETLHYITIHQKRIEIREGWCETLQNNTSEKNWLWWRVVWDLTLHSDTSQKNWPAWMLHGLCFGEEAGARNLVFFRVKWLQPAMKVPRVCGGCGCGRFMRASVPPLCSATGGCSCVRSSMRFLNLWWQILLEWLHACCTRIVLGRKPEHETLCFSV